MTEINIPFLPGDEVGIIGFTSRGIISEVRLRGGDDVSYEVFEAWEGGNKIGYFDVHELYSLED